MAPKFACTGIAVADMARTLAFYRQLGLEVPADADGQPHVEVALPGGLKLLFDTDETIKSFDDSFSPSSGEGRIGLAFECADPAEVDATHDALVASGAASHLAPWDAFWGQRYAVVADPDGNHVELFAALPAS
jgi:catechol 2,3-dioxygenase-like lactoylglutathione lyase family enzyme